MEVHPPIGNHPIGKSRKPTTRTGWLFQSIRISIVGFTLSGPDNPMKARIAATINTDQEINCAEANSPHSIKTQMQNMMTHPDKALKS